MELRSIEILWSSSQFLLDNLANSVISTSMLLGPNRNVAMTLTFVIGLTICLTRICFGSLVSRVNFYYLIGGDVNFQAWFLILISFLKVMDLNDKRFSLVFNSWILSNIGFLLKFDKTESTFAIISLKICKSLTLITFFCSLIWIL